MSGYAFFVQETPTQPKVDWPRNGMIFATETEAKQYGCDLLSRWFGICGGEVRPVELHPTYKWVDGRAESLPQQICEAVEAVEAVEAPSLPVVEWQQKDSVVGLASVTPYDERTPPTSTTICPDCATSSGWAGGAACPSCGSGGPGTSSNPEVPND